jgi:TolB-like protein
LKHYILEVFMKMKGIRVVFFALVVLTALFAGCASVPGAGASTLDGAIELAALNMGTTFGQSKGGGQRPIIAILNFGSPSEKLSAYVLDELTLALAQSVERNFTIVDRHRLDVIRREENFQMSGEVSEESAQAIGKKLGANYVVTGSLSDLASVYRFRVMALEVETAAIVAPTRVDVPVNDKRLAQLLKDAPMQPKQPDGTWVAMQNAAKRNSLEGPSLIFYGDADTDGADATSGFTNEVAIHFSPMPFVSLGVALGSGIFDGHDKLMWTLSPQLGFVIPLSTSTEGFQMHLFGDGLIQIDDIHAGILTDSITLGFDAGLSLVHDNGLGMNMTYKGLWYANEVYTHGVGASFRFWPSGYDEGDLFGWGILGFGGGLWLYVTGLISLLSLF